MPLVGQQGYLEQSYLDFFPYMSAQRQYGNGIQISMFINKEDAIGVQSELRIDTDKTTGSQVEQIINEQSNIGTQTELILGVNDPVGMQIESYIGLGSDAGIQTEMFVNKLNSLGSQVELKYVNKESPIGVQIDMAVGISPALGIQTEMRIDDLKAVGGQVLMHILDKLNTLGLQVEGKITDSDAIGVETKIGILPHWFCEKYLVTKPYLTDSYLSPCMKAGQPVQVDLKIITEQVLAAQVEQKIADFTDVLGNQVEMRVFTDSPIGTQIDRIGVGNIGAQINLIIYNTTQLRLLCDFASRGTPALGGTNWTSEQPIKAGDFSPDNLNTDILEQRCQSDGIKALWELRCDTGISQGAFVDTCAILEHNFSKSARVTFQGSNDSIFGSVGFSEVLVTELVNMYYISPTLPTESFRYWRFIIEDPTNPADDLYIGTILFGASNIFTKRECFDNPVRFGKQHFKESIPTEGFTNVSNDRATRKFLGLNFSELKLDGGNYKTLQTYFAQAKTDIKCLVIPTPYRPSTMAVFAKLTKLPDEEHRAITATEHYVSLALDWDESL